MLEVEKLERDWEWEKDGVGMEAALARDWLPLPTSSA
jgi:hypothetical protein